MNVELWRGICRRERGWVALYKASCGGDRMLLAFLEDVDAAWVHLLNRLDLISPEGVSDGPSLDGATKTAHEPT